MPAPRWRYHEISPVMSALSAILHEICPRCRRGRIFRRSLFRGWLSMNEHCPVCGLKFEREQGYFLGAMYVSFGLSILPVCLLVLLIWAITRWPLDRVVICTFFVYLPAVPLVVRFSRVVWIHIDRHFDP
jgi:uncharacterized protein (DUF983 family)